MNNNTVLTFVITTYAFHKTQYMLHIPFESFNTQMDIIEEEEAHCTFK